MALRLSNYKYGSKRRPGEGLRLGSARLLPRGVKKENYAARDYMDVWLPTLAPSKELLSWIKSRDVQDTKTWNSFLQRYRTEMKQTTPRQTIRIWSGSRPVSAAAVRTTLMSSLMRDRSARLDVIQPSAIRPARFVST